MPDDVLEHEEFYNSFCGVIADFVLNDPVKSRILLEKIKKGTNDTLRRLRTPNVAFPVWEEKPKEVTHVD